MKIPAIVKKNINASLRKGEYDLRAIGLDDVTAPLEGMIRSVIDTMLNAISDVTNERIEAMMNQCVKAIMNDITIRIENDYDDGKLIVAFNLWDEFWHVPLTYQHFRFMEFEENDTEQESKVEVAISQLSSIIEQLKQKNEKFRRKVPKNF